MVYIYKYICIDNRIPAEIVLNNKYVFITHINPCAFSNMSSTVLGFNRINISTTSLIDNRVFFSFLIKSVCIALAAKCKCLIDIEYTHTLKFKQ